MGIKRLFPLQQALLGSLATLVAVAPAMAQTANFSPLALGPGSTSASGIGFTAGFYSLSDIASRDNQGNICFGFATADPDHILTLAQDVAQLTVQVDSGGNDTALLIQGPGATIHCGQDISRSNPDEMIQARNWPAGTYRIWVGTQQEGGNYDYTLNVTAQ